MTTEAAPQGFLLRFVGFIAALCACVAAEGMRCRRGGPVTVLAWSRLRRLCARFESLAARPPAPPRHRARRPGRAAARSPLPRAAARSPLPRDFGWLRQTFPAAAALAPQLRALLDTPDMQGFIAATPTAGRILRPLCHTLGLRLPPILALPPRERKPRPKPVPDPAPKSVADPAPDPASAATYTRMNLAAPHQAPAPGGKPVTPWPRPPDRRFIPPHRLRT
ncbi:MULTISPECIES: hypothetical protein [unclassified Acidiphilium]|uniref:hypothetical protein n=1 Tax=unclassified Acidiphilium TaxID=2617493 RepID=UPI000BCF73A4|nr:MULTISPECIES: hypothetical protein [unclassified Acidiphilium]OYV57254.1 MAG: hypothetical protein B7Z76_01965 [Acidiphilium sp. 20-67-58]HQT60574.1 hypothetical protein [Acidiphilium sp.]